MVATSNRGFAKRELRNTLLPNRELPIAELPNAERPNRESLNGVLPKCEFSKFDSTRLGEIADPVALGAFVAIPGEVVLIAEEGVVGLELSAHMSRPCPDQLFVADPLALDPAVNERFEPALKLGA